MRDGETTEVAAVAARRTEHTEKDKTTGGKGSVYSVSSVVGNGGRAARGTLTIGPGAAWPGMMGTAAISLSGQSRKACAVNGTILYDPGVIMNPSVSDAGIAAGKRVKFWRKAPGELHFIIFSDIPVAFSGGGTAGDIARVTFGVSPSATPGTTTTLRWSTTFPGDADYEGVRGTAICDVDGVSETPAMADGVLTVRSGLSPQQIIDYLLGRTPSAPAGSDRNADSRIDIGDVVRRLGE